ncbi:MAG: hypothetical protein WC028_12865 [Candidatus Obscuribacterales bacterium]
MTKYAAENFNDNSSDSRATSSSLSESVNSNMTLEDIKAILSKKIAPDNACIRDQDGYIACGPVVGMPRPEQPGSGIFMLPEKPLNPPIDKLPPKYEPLNPTEKWPSKPYELLLDRSNK